MYICALCACLVPTEVRRGPCVPRAGVRDHSLGLRTQTQVLEEQSVLLTALPSLWPLPMCFWMDTSTYRQEVKYWVTGQGCFAYPC